MKHTIRQRVINEFGLPVVKITNLNGELGSGILDLRGKEIFEGDIINDDGDTSPVTFKDGSFWAFDGHILEHFKGSVSVVGHVADQG